MQAVIYAGLRNGARDQQIHDALIYKHFSEVAEEFRLSPNTIRATAKRIEKAVLFDLKLLGGSQCTDWQGRGGLLPQGSPGRVRSYHGTFLATGTALLGDHRRNLRIEVTELRKIDTGEVSL